MRFSRLKNFEAPAKGPILSSWCSYFLLAVLCGIGPQAWAYKVEKVCTDIAATASDPAKRICKIVRKVEEKDAPKDEKKEEKKEEKKHGGH